MNLDSYIGLIVTAYKGAWKFKRGIPTIDEILEFLSVLTSDTVYKKCYDYYLDLGQYEDLNRIETLGLQEDDYIIIGFDAELCVEDIKIVLDGVYAFIDDLGLLQNEAQIKWRGKRS